MNLLYPITVSKVFFILMLLGSTTACYGKSAPVNTRLKEKAFATRQVQTVQKGDITGELIHQRRKRTYYLHTPKSYNPNRPMSLVIAFHGHGSQGKNLAFNTGFSELAERKGFIIVYPDGIDRRWNTARNTLLGVNDVSFVKSLIDNITQIRAIDKRKIYAVGVSNGGFLVQRLACEPNIKIAAFASVVATLPGELKSSCDRTAPTSMLMINGTLDRKVPWSGGRFPGGSFLSVPDTINFWRQHNSCTPKVAKQILNKRVDITRYPNCQGDAELELVTLKDAGHVWPRGGSGSGELLNGSQEIWDFFQRHQLPNGKK